MKNVFIKVNELDEYDYRLIKTYTDKDLVSIDDLLVIIDNLKDEKEYLEEEIRNSKQNGQVEPDYYDEWHDRKLCEE